MKLLMNAAGKAALGFLLMGLLLFLPAGTLAYPGAWIFIGLLALPMAVMGVIMALKAPELLKKRLDMKERRGTQKGVVALSGLQLAGCFLLAGLDFRFGWSSLPGFVTAGAAALQLAAYGMYAEVTRENAWLSRTVEVQQGQQLVSTGLYGVVRHPMYSSTALLWLAIPLVLGSLPAALLMALYPLLLARRIRDEEALLQAELPGYGDYMKKVRWRLIPFVW